MTLVTVTNGPNQIFRRWAQRRHDLAAADGARLVCRDWRLGSLTLSAADIAAIYPAVAAFAFTGALAAPVTSNRETTVVRQSDNAARPGADPIPQLEIVQGGDSVFLTQGNAADLAPQLAAIASP